MTFRKKFDLIAHQLSELEKQYPSPTEEQFEVAKRIASASEVVISDDVIRRALKCSINRETEKFDVNRFWQVLPEFVEQKKMP